MTGEKPALSSRARANMDVEETYDDEDEGQLHSTGGHSTRGGSSNTGNEHDNRVLGGYKATLKSECCCWSNFI